jgi:hypothetical protein
LIKSPRSLLVSNVYKMTTNVPLSAQISNRQRTRLFDQLAHRCRRRSVSVRASRHVEWHQASSCSERASNTARACSPSPLLTPAESFAYRTQDLAINCSLQTWLKDLSFPHRIQRLYRRFYFCFIGFHLIVVLYSSNIVMRLRSVFRWRTKSTVVIIVIAML